MVIPPGQQLCLTQENAMEKFWPLAIPVSRLLAFLTPERKISTEPFFRVLVVQLENKGEPHVMSAAGTPVSISAREVQFTPLVLVKNNVPVPLSGTVN